MVFRILVSSWVVLAATVAHGADPLEVVLRLVDEAEVPAAQSGILMEVNVREGTVLKQGELVAVIQDKEAQLQAEKAMEEWKISKNEKRNKAPVEAAKKAEQLAKSHYDRIRNGRLKNKNAYSLSEEEDAELKWSEAVQKHKQAVHELEAARLQERVKKREHLLAQHILKTHRIFAPWDGEVAEVFCSDGEWVEKSEKVIRIIYLKKLRAEGYIQANEAAALEMGDQVTFRPEGSTMEFPGNITFIGKEIDPVDRKVRIWAEIENPKTKLGPGAPGDLFFKKAGGE